MHSQVSFSAGLLQGIKNPHRWTNNERVTTTHGFRVRLNIIHLLLNKAIKNPHTGKEVNRGGLGARGIAEP